MTPITCTQQGDSGRGDKNLFRKFLSFRLRAAVMLASLLILAGGAPAAGVSAQPGKTDFHQAVRARAPLPLIHIPFFDTADVFGTNYSEMAVFWFGKVSPGDNYSHVRMGYNQQQLTVEANIYDRQVWYDDQSPSAYQAANWDSVSLYFLLPAGAQSASRLFRFDAQLSHWQERDAYQAVFERRAGGWNRLSVPFVTQAAYRGDGINSPADDKGWIANFEIPFSSLGIRAAPPYLSEWKMGVRVYDQDSGPGGTTRSQVWPPGFSEHDAASFSTVTFGYPPPTRIPLPVSGSTIIKQRPGVSVPDASVGGHSMCGGDFDYWKQWGDVVYDQGKPAEETVIQNQRDVADFPCFSRYYVTFPLSAVPPGKVILSAKLILHQFGNSDPTGALPSYIHIYRVREDWSETSITWNNSPAVLENYPGAWVDPLLAYPEPPGVARTWDVTQALLANMKGESRHELRLVMQSGDWALHSGKYFWASEAVEWNPSAAPTLLIQWASP